MKYTGMFNKHSVSDFKAVTVTTVDQHLMYTKMA